jgi:alpha-glucosidase/alpha-D-xyloside xylohydrolase
MRRDLFGFILILGFLAAGEAVLADALRYGGRDAELTIYKVSEKTIGIKLLQLDPNGKPLPLTDSSITVDFPREVIFGKREIEETTKIKAGGLEVSISSPPLKIIITNSGGVVQELIFSDSNDVVSFETNGPVLGMGEGANQFDRRGKFYSMEPRWNAGIYGSTVPSPMIIGTDGWAMFISRPEVSIDLRENKGQIAARQRKNNGIEIFVTAWEKPEDVFAEYIHLTGAPVMPPKWTMGYMQSHRTLAGPNEVLNVAETFREKKLPCDTLIYLGTGYCPAGWNLGHASLDFNPKTFDKPAEMIGNLKRENFHIVLHINNPPKDLHGKTISEPSDSNTHINSYWKRHSATYALGVDGWWPDDGDELPQEARIARHRCYYEGPLADRANVRPWSLHRTGTAGVARYGGWIWSGDVDSKWATLAAQVPVGLNHSLSLTPFWGTDTGGFYPTRELTGELYVRWFQFSAFCPLFRSHGRTWHLRLPWGWNTGEPGPVEHNRSVDPNELHNGAVEPICRKYLELRYRLLTYNYGLCRQAHDMGLPLMRALWLYYPKDSNAAARGDEYLWGADFLVAPVVEKGASERRVYLPEGVWYDFWTNQKHTGGREIVRKVDLATMPLYVRAGAIVPLDPLRQYTDEIVDGPLTLRIYTGCDGEYRWYRDDGKSLDYLKDKFSWTKIKWLDSERRLVIEPDEGAKSFGNWPKQILVELIPDGTVKTIDFNGQRLELKF